MKWMNDVLSFNTILCPKILYGTYTKKIDWSFFWNSHVTGVLLLVYDKDLSLNSGSWKKAA